MSHFERFFDFAFEQIFEAVMVFYVLSLFRYASFFELCGHFVTSLVSLARNQFVEVFDQFVRLFVYSVYFTLTTFRLHFDPQSSNPISHYHHPRPIFRDQCAHFNQLFRCKFDLADDCLKNSILLLL